MANKRMFNISIVDSDAFLDMPASSQLLYFHLNMRADDDGFIGNPKRIARLIGASDDDIKILIAKRFVLVMEDGVIVIKHWRMHNTIRADRYTPTAYQDQLSQLFIKENKSYTLTNEDGCKSLGNQMATKWQPNASTDIDIDLDIDKEDIYMTFPLKDGNEYELKSSSAKMFNDTFKNIDVYGELLKAKSWLISNPEKRKTSRGMMKFLNGWLLRVTPNQTKEAEKPKEEVVVVDEEELKKQQEELMSMFNSKC